MSSSTITVKPQRRTARSPPPTQQSTNQNKGTVLLRNPLPKYSFEQQSRTKKEEKSSTTNKGEKIENQSKYYSDTIDKKEIKEHVKEKETSPQSEFLPVGKLIESFPQTSQVLVSKVDSATKNNADIETCVKDKPVNKVGPINKLTGQTLTHSVSDSVLGIQNVSENGASLLQQTIPEQVINSEQSGTQLHSGSLIDDSGGNQQTVSVNNSKNLVQCTVSQCQGNCNCSERVKQLEEEKQLLKNQLEVQLQVNQELKKLLVASVGDDLQHRVEKLMRDKAQLSIEICDYSKKMTDDYEHLDKISIQADMWRSKFLASRVMTDELASSKAFYMMQFQECQMAVQKLLNERHQLRANLYDTYRGLSQIQAAFDPLGSQTARPGQLTSKNAIDLARTNQHLVDTIKYRLLPSHVTAALNSKMELDWHDYLTPAEAHAQELLTREMRPEDFRCLVPSRSIMAAPGSMSVDRFHPCANYDNLTLNVCCKCKGEISIV